MEFYRLFNKVAIHIREWLIRLIMILDYRFERFLDFVVADIRRIPNHHIKPLRNPEHPLRIKEIGGSVLVVGIPISNLFGFIGRHSDIR